MNDLDEADFIVRQRASFNAEPLPGQLIAHYLTPQLLSYVRSHGATPHLGHDHAIRFGGDGLCDAALTLAELRARFPARRIVAAMQCAGTRRADLQAVGRTNGDQ